MYTTQNVCILYYINIIIVILMPYHKFNKDIVRIFFLCTYDYDKEVV